MTSMFDEAKMTAFYKTIVKQVINTTFTAKGCILLKRTLGMYSHFAKNYYSGYFN